MYPTPEEAKKIIAAGDYKRIPVTMELNSDMVTPVMAVKRLKKVSHHCFMLESAEADKKWGRYTFLGFDPTLELTCQDGVLKIKSGFEITEKVTHPMEYIRKIIKDNKTPVLEGLPPFAGGLVGYFSYDYIKYSEPSLKLNAKDEESFKDVDLMLFDKIICFDNYRQKIILIVNVRTENFDTSYNKGVMELENMKKLISYGFTFSLDDFGKGESNLMYVVEMPVSIIKLDYDMSKHSLTVPKPNRWCRLSLKCLMA